MDELIANVGCLMSPDIPLPNYEMGELLDAIPTIKTRKATVPRAVTTSNRPMPAQAQVPFDEEEWNRPWGGGDTTEEEDLIREEAAREAEKIRRYGEFWDLPHEQRDILQKEKMILARLELMRDGAQHVFRAFEEAKEVLPTMIGTLTDKHDACTHEYGVACLHLDPEHPAAQKVQGAMERLRIVEMWCRAALLWATDAYQRLKPYYGLYKELADTQKTRFEAMKENIIGAHNAAEYGTPWSSDRIKEVPLVGITEDKLKHRYPKIVRMPGPRRLEQYQAWPKDEAQTIEPAIIMYEETIMMRANYWGLFEGQ